MPIYLLLLWGFSPLITVVLSHIVAHDDKLNRLKIVSLALSLVGLLLIVGMGNNGAPLDWPGVLGILLLLLCILFQGYSAIRVSEESKTIDPIFLNATQMFFLMVLALFLRLPKLWKNCWQVEFFFEKQLLAEADKNTD